VTSTVAGMFFSVNSMLFSQRIDWNRYSSPRVTFVRF